MENVEEKKKNRFKNEDVFVWITLLGFDRDQDDKGVNELIDRIGFVPDGMSIFVYHPDIIHTHDGMDKEILLPPDNCTYFGVEYNEERASQPWTNYDVRTLSRELRKAGVSPYMSIMGANLENRFHDEWGNKHSETKLYTRTEIKGLNVLKRFKDGTFYEDFFVDKLCETLIDYELDGIHITDHFCPALISIHDGDFSADMLDQFISHSNVKLPKDLEEGMSRDDFDEINKRGDWIWANCRQEWIEFLAWRWGEFWKKICAKVHTIGKKVIVLGTYCTAPFETLYCLGIDLKALMDAGVDYLMPNPSVGTMMTRTDRRYRYHQYMAMVPLLAAYLPEFKSLCMLGVKDSAEEWDWIHFNPSFLERNITGLSGNYITDGESTKRCIDGFMICLGDAMSKESWNWLGERLDVAFEDNIPEKIYAPSLVWSDEGFKNLLPSYIADRRWTVHKFVYEMSRQGAYTGHVWRIENLDKAEGPLFIPNFDLLSESEKAQIAAYKKGAVVCTASAEHGFNPSQYGIKPDIYFEDQNSDYKHCAFAFNHSVENKDEIFECLKIDEYDEDLNEPFETEESTYTLTNTLPFVKVSTGFAKACSMLLKSTHDCILKSDHPILCMKLKDGRMRMWVVNENRLCFDRATVVSKKPIKEVVNVTKFPVLPVKYIEDPNEKVWFVAKDISGDKYAFSARLAPDGISIFDVIFKD